MLEVSRYQSGLTLPDYSIAWKIQLWHIYEKYDGLAEIYQETGTRYPFHLGKEYSGELVNGKTVSHPSPSQLMLIERDSLVGRAI